MVNQVEFFNAESLRDKAMKYYTECQSERAQASASNPSLSSFGSKGSSMGSMGAFRIDECPKDEETKCDLGCVLKKLGAKDNQIELRSKNAVVLSKRKSSLRQREREDQRMNMRTRSAYLKYSFDSQRHIKDNKLIATTTKDMCEAKDPAKKKKLDDAIDACATKVGTQKNECETGAAVCKCIMEYGAYQAFFDSC
uniref:Uncharacterized protein n=1 Tax=Timema monikensis TaxID=170555 RepID=A0A7R9EKV8_9NEOP|nr:unnamed protein product [Timema monikensis]